MQAQMSKKMNVKWVPCAGLALGLMVVGGCRSERPVRSAGPVVATDNTLEGRVVGDDRTAMEAAVDGAGTTPAPADDTTLSTTPAAGGVALAPNAPDSYVVKRGDTLWGIAKVFLRDPWFWPEIWQVNPQVQNPHLIYPGDTLRLVYVEGRPKIVLQRTLERGGGAQVVPRVRSQPLDAAITTIPYETIAAFMSKPSVLTKDQIKGAGYILAARDNHVTIAEGNTIYARGFVNPAEVGMRYSVMRIGDELRDPDDNKLLGYNGIYTGTGRVTRSGDPATLVMTDSTRESESGDKVLPGNVDVALDFIPSAPRNKVDGRIMAVNDGVTTIGQYQVVVINRGARDGLVPGNVLAVFRAGATITDEEKNGFVSGTVKFFEHKVRLPDERVGTFMVFKTFDQMSFGLIMEAKNIIRVKDFVENP
jgi:LysM repeat protein